MLLSHVPVNYAVGLQLLSFFTADNMVLLSGLLGHEQTALQLWCRVG